MSAKSTLQSTASNILQWRLQWCMRRGRNWTQKWFSSVLAMNQNQQFALGLLSLSLCHALGATTGYRARPLPHPPRPTDSRRSCYHLRRITALLRRIPRRAPFTYPRRARSCRFFVGQASSQLDGWPTAFGIHPRRLTCRFPPPHPPPRAHASPVPCPLPPHAPFHALRPLLSSPKCGARLPHPSALPLILITAPILVPFPAHSHLLYFTYHVLSTTS
ncbi:hypothetical protein B0H13DRAFT_2353754 [Mycena leptocephala]|nr:hypothetical protein B0H13DRAFT_2353754 [Mycena leptocephala]